MSTKNYEYDGKEYTIKQLVIISRKFRPEMNYACLYNRLKRMPPAEAVEGRETKQTICICGCGRPAKPGAKYHDIRKCRHVWLRNYVWNGCCQPDEWRICPCGEEFPVFFCFPSHKQKTTCSSECSNKYIASSIIAREPKIKVKNREEHCFRRKDAITNLRCSKYPECDFMECSGYTPEAEVDDIMKGSRRSSLAAIGRFL